jgi:hypothetical protein
MRGHGEEVSVYKPGIEASPASNADRAMVFK